MTGFTLMIGLLDVGSVPFLIEGVAACTFFPDPIRIALSYNVLYYLYPLAALCRARDAI